MAWLGDPLKINVHNGSKKMTQSPKMKLGEIFLLIWILSILAGIIFYFINMGVSRIGELFFILYSLPSVVIVFFLMSINLWIFILVAVFFLWLIPVYAPDVIHLRGMSIAAVFSIFIFVVFYFQEGYPKNVFITYRGFRVQSMLWCSDFFTNIISKQRVAPNTFYDRVLYKHLKQYQECLNEIVLDVLGKDCIQDKRIDNLKTWQKKKILLRADKLNKAGLESGYLLAMLHQYFIHNHEFDEYKAFLLREPYSQSIFNWVEVALSKYPYEGEEAWQNVLLVYWPNHLGEERE